jgi:hypothetical protein
MAKFVQLSYRHCLQDAVGFPIDQKSKYLCDLKRAEKDEENDSNLSQLKLGYKKKEDSF